MHNADHIIYNKIFCMILQGDKVRTECVDDKFVSSFYYDRHSEQILEYGVLIVVI